MAIAFIAFALDRVRTGLLAFSLIIMAKIAWLAVGPIVASVIGLSPWR